MNLFYSHYCILNFLATCDFLRKRYMLTSPGTISLEFTTADASTMNHSKWKPTDKMGVNGNPSIDELHLHESVQASNLTDSDAIIDEAHEWLKTIFSRVKDLINDYFQQTRHHVIYEILISAIALILFIAYKMFKTNTELPRRRTRRRTKNNRDKRTRNKSDNIES